MRDRLPGEADVFNCSETDSMAGCDESDSVEEGIPEVGFRRDVIAEGVPERSGKCSETFRGG